MGGDAPKVEGTRVVGIAVADTPVKTRGVRQTAGAVMSHRSCKHLLRATVGDDRLPSVARPIAPKPQVDLARVPVDPNRLIAGQRAR